MPVPPPTRIRPPVPSLSGDPLRILVVDDDPAILRLCRFLLTEAGHDVHVVSSGEAALEQVQASRWDVMLIDLCMPGMDGIETTARIPALVPQEEEPVVIGLTAVDRATERARCIAVGMESVLYKPAAFSSLAADIARLTGERRRERSAGRSPPAVPPEFYTELVADLQDHGRTLAASAAAPAMRAIAHRIAGATGIFGMSELSLQARELCAAIDEERPVEGLVSELLGAIEALPTRLPEEGGD